MNQTSFIAQIAPPEHISAMPPLAVLILLLLLTAGLLCAAWMGGRWWRRRRDRNAPFQAANRVLSSLNPALADLPVQTQAILKRTALAYQPRSDVAALSEQQWYQWLDSHLPPAKQGQWPLLMGNPYARSSQHGGQLLLSHARLTLRAISAASALRPTSSPHDDR